MADGPLVSVITPVFNGQEYLEECLASVRAQTYTNWSYSIVDNASTDSTPDIASRFARSDSRISHVRFDDFVDAITNHNRAFDLVDPTSEYCKVVQADDWIFPDCLARMVEVARASESIGLVTSYRLSELGVDLAGLPYDQTVFDGKQILREELLRRRTFLGAPSATLYRTRFMLSRERPFYRAPGWMADTEAGCWLLSQSDFGFVHQVLTYVRRQGGRRQDYAMNMNAYIPEAICLHLRYGRLALSPIEYRTMLRRLLRGYVLWHAKQFPRPSRLASADFFAMHENARQLILAEGDEDREVRLAMDAVGAMLSRESLVRGRRHSPG
jgi:glycosyltransferase involved in cell wall biosynthesis